jgi:ubiquitin carboxyl-terminal hydrolase 5/13
MLDAAAAAALAAVELQDGRWVIFNDEKVAASEHPPLSMGYMYFYRRIGDSTPAQQ